MSDILELAKLLDQHGADSLILAGWLYYMVTRSPRSDRAQNGMGKAVRALQSELREHAAEMRDRVMRVETKLEGMEGRVKRGE